MTSLSPLFQKGAELRSVFFNGFAFFGALNPGGGGPIPNWAGSGVWKVLRKLEMSEGKGPIPPSAGCLEALRDEVEVAGVISMILVISKVGDGGGLFGLEERIEVLGVMVGVVGVVGVEGVVMEEWDWDDEDTVRMLSALWSREDGVVGGVARENEVDSVGVIVVVVKKGVTWKVRSRSSSIGRLSSALLYERSVIHIVLIATPVKRVNILSSIINSITFLGIALKWRS